MSHTRCCSRRRVWAVAVLHLSEIREREGVIEPPSPAKAGGGYGKFAVLRTQSGQALNGRMCTDFPLPESLERNAHGFVTLAALDTKAWAEASWYPALQSSGNLPLYNYLLRARVSSDADVSAALLYPEIHSVSRVKLAPQSRPEVFVSCEGGSCVNVKTAEGKTLHLTAMLNEVIMYSLQAVKQSYFPGGVTSHAEVYYNKPPSSVAELAAGPLAMFVQVECVGQAFASALDVRPVLLGTDAHHETAQQLFSDDEPPTECVELEWKRASSLTDGRTEAPDQWHKCDVKDLAVTWTTAPISVCTMPLDWADSDGGTTAEVTVRQKKKRVRGESASCNRFVKRIDFSAYAPEMLYHIAEVHNKVTQLPGRPESLPDARVYYGEWHLVVVTPWVGERLMNASDVAGTADFSDCAIVRDLADAVSWLLEHGLLYTDWRYGNVRVASTSGEGGAGSADAAAYLIDLDDVVKLEAAAASERVASPAAYIERVRAAMLASGLYDEDTVAATAEHMSRTGWVHAVLEKATAT